ncbi:MAG TPA: aldo/keto reductase [Acidimicrobiales bacterium]|jgi:aryl-alcohol dehydrogenase-like predicted oxidoreductase|nr:aldo/keto reductase [Acidimicrobiales bacterium]
MIDRVEFGRTGHHSSRVIFGAAALGTMHQDAADRVLGVLEAFGVNHLDTAAGYGDSELRLAPWLANDRDRFFLATKTGDRSGGAARASLERSLTRLGVDHVDLIQLHNLVEEDEWQTAHGPHGALAALVRARDEGLTRFIGVTGHGLRIAAMHRRSLERFDYDSVLLPFNYALLRDDNYRRDCDALLATCAEARVAVQTIKSAARRRWAPDDPSPHFSWYEPLPEGQALARSVQWVLGGGAHEGQLFVNSSSDARLLPSIMQAASDAPSQPRPTDDQLAADLVTAGVTPLFDGGALETI